MTSDPISLNQRNLQELSRRVTAPSYDRNNLGRGVVHIGAGGFNRSHLAVYLDDLLERGESHRWGECGIGLLPPDAKIHEALTAQDHLYSVLSRDPGLESVRIIGSIVEHIYAPSGTEAALERMSDPECAIVSLTVTEGGYFIDDSSKEFMDSHALIQGDLAHPFEPVTFLGYLAEAADRRRRRGIAPFTVMSCDNLQGNGATARKALLGFAEMRDPQLRRWIEENVSFPNSMVDRITPSTTAEDKVLIEGKFGIRDLSPVTTESFRQWVIEDEFVNDRPSFEKVGAQFTSDVAPFEKIKMRLLNGGHSAIAYVAALLDFSLVAQALEDEQIRMLLEQFLEEAEPVLPNVSGMNIADYKTAIVRRFSNPAIRDQVPRIASEGSAKLSKFIVPTAAELRSLGKTPRILPLVIASWLHAMCGVSDTGRHFAIADSSADLLAPFRSSRGRNVSRALSIQSIFGDLVASDFPVVQGVQEHIDSFHEVGVRATVRRVLDRAQG
jgi:mannitol 2-dehydrogenase